MNVTLFIGNGFDINLGLNTGYRDFLAWYLEQPSSNPIIGSFKKMIDKDIETWSDLEKALGEQTNYEPLNDPNNFIKCKENLDINLYHYLKKQQRSIEDCITSEAISLFSMQLDGLFNYFSPSAVVKTCKESMYDSEINVITFNYTEIFDRFWENAEPGIALRGKLIHVHGTLEHDMIVGVNDISQIANANCNTDQRIIDMCVKPHMNDYCDPEKVLAVEEIISNTDIFIVFGMSIGITDKIWWEKVIQQVLNNSNGHIFIVNYHPLYRPALPYHKHYKTDFMNNMLHFMDLDKEKRKQLLSKISIELNTELFNLSEYLITTALHTFENYHAI